MEKAVTDYAIWTMQRHYNPGQIKVVLTVQDPGSGNWSVCLQCANAIPDIGKNCAVLVSVDQHTNMEVLGLGDFSVSKEGQ